MASLSNSMTQCIGCLQALQDTLTQGQQALETMQLSLSQLQRQTLSVAEPKAMERLWKLAPSFCFGSNDMKNIAHYENFNSAEGLSAGCTSLQAAALTAQLHLASLSAAGAQYQMAVLAQASSQQGVALTPVQSGASSALTQPGACSAISSASFEDGEDRSRTGVPIQPQEVVAVQPGLECEQPEEVALLILAAVKGLEQDVKWMSDVAHSVSLSTTVEELQTISVFWQLQPFTDDALLDALIQATGAAADLEGRADHV